MTTGVFWQPRKGLAGWLMVALGYFLAYILLDNLNYRRTGVLDENAPLLLNAGLPYILILSFGRRFLPAVLLAPVLSEVLLDQTRLPMGVEISRDLAIGAVACFAQLLLTSRRLAFDPSLATIRTLMILFVVVMLESAGAASITVLARMIMEANSLAPNGRMILDSFVAQFLGMVVIAPLGLFFFRRIWLVLKPLDWLLHISAIGLVFVLLFSIETERPFQSFYLLSLPVLWMAVRGGIEAASVGIALTQIGLIVSQRFVPNVQMNVVDLQMRLMVLSILGLVTGVLVVERLRFERQLRRHQEAVARMARIASMSQLASSIAHEINQPLMAAGTYTRLATRAMETTPDRPESALVPARKAGEQIERAGGGAPLAGPVQARHHPAQDIEPAGCGHACAGIVPGRTCGGECSVPDPCSERSRHGARGSTPARAGHGQPDPERNPGHWPGWLAGYRDPGAARRFRRCCFCR